jgi:hypothetical protein
MGKEDFAQALGWRQLPNGWAAVCKTAFAGSNPAAASRNTSRSWEARRLGGWEQFKKVNREGTKGTKKDYLTQSTQRAQRNSVHFLYFACPVFAWGRSSYASYAGALVRLRSRTYYAGNDGKQVYVDSDGSKEHCSRIEIDKFSKPSIIKSRF